MSVLLLVSVCDSLRLEWPEGLALLRENGVDIGDEDDLR